MRGVAAAAGEVDGGAGGGGGGVEVAGGTGVAGAVGAGAAGAVGAGARAGAGCVAIAFGSIASAAIRASAEMTSPHAFAETSRGWLASPSSTIVSRPTKRSRSKVTTTWKVRASSFGPARRAFAVRART